MKNNVIKVFLYGREICKLQWNGGYKPGFGKLGSVVSFNPDYHTFGFDIDPMGPYSLSTYFVRKGMSDICRRGEYEGLPRFLSGSLPDDWGNQVFSQWIDANNLGNRDITSVDKEGDQKGSSSIIFVGREPQWQQLASERTPFASLTSAPPIVICVIAAR